MIPGDLVEMRGSRGLIVEIKKNNYPPYQVWYRVHWQDSPGCIDWVPKGTYKSFRKI